MTDAAVAEAPARVDDPAPRPDPQVEGRLDAVANGRVYGWAWDKANPADVLAVEIRHGGRVLARVLADQGRQDLRAGGIGDRAFEVELADAPPLEELEATAYPHDGMGWPLAVPSAGQKELESAVGPYFQQVAAAVEALRRDHRQLSQNQQALARRLQPLSEQRPAASEEALAKVLAGIAALDERVGAVEVSLVRLDETLRGLGDGVRSAGKPSGQGGGLPLPVALGMVGGLVLAGALALIAVLAS